MAKSGNAVEFDLQQIIAAQLQGQSFANTGNSQERLFVPYMDLSGGLNTRKDAHALARNELATLVNGWYLQDKICGKRPGLTPLVTANGSTNIAGVAKGLRALVAARFGGQTWLLIQDGNGGIWYAPSVPAGSSFTWKQIGSINKLGTMRGAQMYDPQRGSDALFIVSGYDVPQYWLGPATMLAPVDTTVNHLPTKAGSTTQPITPAFVQTLGNNSHLFYSGEPSAPSAVYVSDPFFPESFSTPLTQVNPMAGAYQPALIGNNDGVDGGNITGLDGSLGIGMLVFKQSALYIMLETQLLGDVAFMVSCISRNRGCLSPGSIVPMDGFVGYLSVDGVYVTDGSTATQISGNVPTFFDSTVLGSPALIANRTTAIAFRHGTRYIIFFDTGTGSPDTGVWFDWAVTANANLPATGQINFTKNSNATTAASLYVAGAATLTGPKDDGNVAIAAANGDFVGKFGIGFEDIYFNSGAPLSSPILVTLRGKADFFEDVFGDDAPAALKNLDKIRLFVSVFNTSVPNATLTFYGNVITDVANEYPITALPAELPQETGPRWGTVAEGGTGDTWGDGIRWTATPATQGLYFDLPILAPLPATAKIIQMEFSEMSNFGWSILGYALQIGKQQVND